MYIQADITRLENENPVTLRRIAANPSTRPATLARIYNAICNSGRYYDEQLMECLAGNPSTPRGILIKLSQPDIDPLSRHIITSYNRLAKLVVNPNTPKYIVNKWITNDSVQYYVASDLKATPEMLLEVARHLNPTQHDTVAIALLQNPNVPQEVVDMLPVDRFITYIKVYFECALTANLDEIESQLEAALNRAGYSPRCCYVEEQPNDDEYYDEEETPDILTCYAYCEFDLIRVEGLFDDIKAFIFNELANLHCDGFDWDSGDEEQY